MKKVLLSVIFICLSNISFGQLADHVVIAEIYGGGGNSTSSPYQSDYILLYNPTGSAVSLTNWTLQYAQATSQSYAVINLSGSIPANSYYMVQCLTGSNGVPLPYYPDLISGQGISPSLGGKLALVNNQTTLTADPDSLTVGLIDFVGFSNATNNPTAYEGSGPAPTMSDAISIRRSNNSGQLNNNEYGLNGSGGDTDDNTADFYQQSSLGLIPNYPLSSSYLANHVVIAEIYGGGGLLSASYTNDYVVLYNAASSSVSLPGYSLQYTSATGTSWTSIGLSGTIPTDSYFLIELGSGGSNGNPLPGTPDLVNTSLDIDAATGKLALVRTQTLLTGSNPVTSNAELVDFVGYGASADGYEGLTGPASSPSSSSSLRREDRYGNSTYGIQNGSGWDANDNLNDFYIESNIIANPPAPKLQLDHAVIAELYTGGGSGTSPTYKYDFVVLYNPTGSSINFTTPDQWTLQRELGNAAGWDQIVNLTGSIAPNSYYVIQGYSPNNVGAELPVTPNVIAPNFNLQLAGSKVALVQGSAPISGFGDGSIVDFVGYGSYSVNPTYYEGGGTAPAPSNIQSIRRKDNNGNNTYGTNGSGWDTNNNDFDFYIENSPVPLPVELTSFTGEVSGKSIKLSWKTETEVQNYGFEIQRMSSAESWHKLGFVEGHGSSNTPWEYSFTDSKVQPGKYTYRLKQIDTDGKYEYSATVDVNFGSLDVYKLNQNYPNPFNPVTSISFNLPSATNVKLVIYNMLGQKVKTLVNGHTEAGFHQVSFDASELSSGVYIYRLDTDSFSKVRKMLLLK